MIKFLDLKKQYDDIKDEIQVAIQDVLEHSAFIGGERVKRFEEAFAAYQQAEHCVGVGNGTDALEIAIEALNLPKGSEIIVPANSFVASAEAVTRAGHTVVFCDCDSSNYTISIDSMRSKISDKTRAIMAVHLYGHPCNMGALKIMADEYGLKIIEDCAQAHGAEYKGKRVGALGDIGAFSFYPGKNLGAYGDAGAIVTNDADLAKKCRMIANHGRIEKYNHQFEGRNSRLDALQAAILTVKLNYLETWTQKRIDVANHYLEGLSGVSFIDLPKREEWAKQVYHLFVIRSEKRESLQAYLKENNVQTGNHYPIALPKLEAYDYVGQATDPFFANAYDEYLLSLPIGDHLSSDEVSQVIELIKAFEG